MESKGLMGVPGGHNGRGFEADPFEGTPVVRQGFDPVPQRALARALTTQSEPPPRPPAPEEGRGELTCGVKLPPATHALLRARAKTNKRTLRAEVVSNVLAAENARKILRDALKYHEHSGHSMPKAQIRDALAVLGIPHAEQP